MHLLRISRSRTWQIALLAAVALLPMAPPRAGAMLILPVRQASSGSTIAWATSAGARLIADGPYRGALMVDGDRARLLLPALRAGALLVAARPPACSLEGEIA